MDQPISSLNLPKYLLQEFQHLGYNYCKDVPSFDVLNVKNAKIETLKTSPQTKSAFELYQEECELGYIPTLFKELDTAVGGGIFVGLITEISGNADTKKTEIWYCL